MKETLQQFDRLRKTHSLNRFADACYTLEYDTETSVAGIVFGFFQPAPEQHQGISPNEFVTLYPKYRDIMPERPGIVSFLEFKTLEDYGSNKLEKAYYIYLDENNTPNDTRFEGLHGYPLSTDPQIAKMAQAGTFVTAKNMRALPDHVREVLPDPAQHPEMEIIRYNEDGSRISYEEEYISTPVDPPQIRNVSSEMLQSHLQAIESFLGSSEIAFTVKHTIGKTSPKLYYGLYKAKPELD